jgi:murein DD-endopeptidase MepM/ murein hydrolase activator NlpD
MDRRNSKLAVWAMGVATAAGTLLVSASEPRRADSVSSTSPAGSPISIHPVFADDHIDLIVENHRLYDVTLSLAITPDDTTALRVKPKLATYPPGSRTVAVRWNLIRTTSTKNPRYTYHWIKGDVNARHDDRVVYRLPYEPGTSRRVIQGYDTDRSHNGVDRYAVDFAMPKGTVVCAARDGVVVDLRDSCEDTDTDNIETRPSNYVSILHGDGTIGEYLHLQHDGVRVHIGQHVAAGTPIALSGNTGYSTRPHLHFAVYSPADESRLQSHRMTFRTRKGLISEPVAGAIYTAD